MRKRRMMENDEDKILLRKIAGSQNFFLELEHKFVLFCTDPKQAEEGKFVVGGKIGPDGKSILSLNEADLAICQRLALEPRELSFGEKALLSWESGLVWIAE